MKIFKKIVAWTAVIVSVIGVLVVIAGLFGSWVVNSKATTLTLSLLTAGENVVMATSNGLNRLDGRLDVSQQRIDSVDQKVISLGNELADTSLLGTAIAKTIGDELIPILESIGDSAAMIRDTATAIDDAFHAVDEIPFITMKRIVPGSNIFTDIADSITDLETSIADTQNEVQERREERAEGLVSTVTGKTDEWRGKVTDVQNRLGEADGSLAESSANLAELKISLPRMFIMITLAIDLVLLVIGIAFVSLFLHGLSYIKNSDQSMKELLL